MSAAKQTAEALLTENGIRSRSEIVKATPISTDNSSEKTKEMLASQKKYKLIINSTERERTSVKIGINGYVYNIPRDVEVIVPEAVVQSLKEASYEVYKQVEGEDKTSMETKKEIVHRFPFQATPIEQ